MVCEQAKGDHRPRQSFNRTRSGSAQRAAMSASTGKFSHEFLSSFNRGLSQTLLTRSSKLRRSRGFPMLSWLFPTASPDAQAHGEGIRSPGSQASFRRGDGGRLKREKAQRSHSPTLPHQGQAVNGAGAPKEAAAAGHQLPVSRNDPTTNWCRRLEVDGYRPFGSNTHWSRRAVRYL